MVPSEHHVEHHTVTIKNQFSVNHCPKVEQKFCELLIISLLSEKP